MVAAGQQGQGAQQLYQHLAGDDPPCAYINGSNLWTAPYINFIHAVTRPPYRSPGAVVECPVLRINDTI